MTHEEKLLLAKQFLGTRYVFHPSRRIKKTTTVPGSYPHNQPRSMRETN